MQHGEFSEACVHLVADDREQAGGVIEALQALPGVALEIRRLNCGDYRVEDRLVVERKALADFARSVVDARLFRQAAATASAEELAAVRGIGENTAAKIRRALGPDGAPVTNQGVTPRLAAAGPPSTI